MAGMCVPMVFRQVRNEGNLILGKAERLFIIQGRPSAGASWKARVTLAREVCVLKFHS